MWLERRMWARLFVLIGTSIVLVACAPSTLDPASLSTAPVFVATFTPFVPALAETATAVQDLPASPEPVADLVTLVDYEVQPGDTLLGLAMTFDVPMAAIQLQNDLGSSTVVKVGDVLVIPPTVGWEGTSPFWVVHAVEQGEVLSTIAAAYGLDVAALQAVNGLSDVDLITVGQPLILPLDAPAEVIAAAHRPTPTPLPPPTATPVPPLPTPLPLDVTPAATPSEPPDSPSTVPTSPPAELPGDVAALPAAIFRLINEQRAAYGLPPYQYNAILAQAAQLHADDCYARGWCGHTGSDGSTMKERIIRAGYDPVRWSECWAWYGSPEGAVAAWMDEVPPNDPHRRTLLSTWLTEVGVGVVPGNGYGYYFIADFGTLRE